uniref:glucuronyl hydrolase n=1 Tax=Parabacteroides faecis TaxID=1217282 RepID=UPI003A9196BA
MKLKTPLLLLLVALTSCGNKPDLVQDNFSFASTQLKQAFVEMDAVRSAEPREKQALRDKQNLGPLASPRNVEADGTLHMVISRDWTSGFFPGELWYMYEYTKDDFWKQKAQEQTALIEREKMNGGTHDMGFKVYCSFGNGYRLTGDAAYKDVLLQAAYTLTTRYKENVGAIRSWDHSRDKWDCPVIIDNMMNLELLFWAFKTSGDSLFYNVAVNHARTTMKNHYRKDYSSYHVVDYDTITGAVLHKHTHQGYAHESAWSRGQAWGLYGYTLCYRETGLPEFLEQAKQIENFIFSHPNLPKDLIPYWDFNAPGIPAEPRDASAATVTASALYELSMYDPANGKDYILKANTILENLSKGYRTAPGKDRGFLLLHSTGSKMHNVEVDVPIVYADYYYLEALLRKQTLEKDGTAILY